MKKVLLSAVAILSASSLFAQSNKMLQVKGSDTMVNVVQVLAEQYMAKNKGKMISVTGGGSGTGIAAILNGTCSLANSSRDIKDKEKKAAKSKVSEFVLGIDGLSIIVNANNPINSLTVEQLGQIFLKGGSITTWDQAGGNKAPIALYGRQPNSGTYDFFREHVVKGDYSDQVRQMNGSAQIVESVKNSANAIGYVGSGYVKNSKDIKILKIATAKDGTAYAPTYNNIVSRLYPISRPLYQYVSGDITDDVRDFIAFELSTAGQNIMTEEGFFPITEKQRKSNYALLGITAEKKSNKTKNKNS